MYWFSEICVAYGSCMEIFHFLWYILGPNYKIFPSCFFLYRYSKHALLICTAELYPLNRKLCWEISGSPKSGWNGGRDFTKDIIMMGRGDVAKGLGGFVAIEIRGVVVMRFEGRVAIWLGGGLTIVMGLSIWEEVGECTLVACILSALLELQP